MFTPISYWNSQSTSTPLDTTNLKIELWSGDYTAYSSTWTNRVSGGPNPTFPSGTWNKNATGVTFSPASFSTSKMFQIASDGVWDNTPDWTVISYFRFGSAPDAQNMFFGKGSGINTHSTWNTISTLYGFRVGNNSSNLNYTDNILSQYDFLNLNAMVFTSTGGTNTNIYENELNLPLTTSGTPSLNLNNGGDFWYGYTANPPSGSVYSIGQTVNRFLLFNKKLTQAEITAWVNYCIINK